VAPGDRGGAVRALRFYRGPRARGAFPHLGARVAAVRRGRGPAAVPGRRGAGAPRRTRLRRHGRGPRRAGDRRPEGPARRSGLPRAWVRRRTGRAPRRTRSPRRVAAGAPGASPGSCSPTSGSTTCPWTSPRWTPRAAAARSRTGGRDGALGEPVSGAEAEWLARWWPLTGTPALTGPPRWSRAPGRDRAPLPQGHRLGGRRRRRGHLEPGPRRRRRLRALRGMRPPFGTLTGFRRAGRPHPCPTARATSPPMWRWTRARGPGARC
jgi:hypothetical protein